MSPAFVYEARLLLDHLQRELHAAAQLSFAEPEAATAAGTAAAARRLCDMLVDRLELLDTDTLQRGMRRYVARRVAVEADFLLAARRHPNVRGRDPAVTLLMKCEPLFSDLCGPRQRARAMAMSVHQPRVVDYFLDAFSRQLLGESLEEALAVRDWRERPALKGPAGAFWSPLHQCWAVVLQGDWQRLRPFRTLPQALCWLFECGVLQNTLDTAPDGTPRAHKLVLAQLREAAFPD